MLMLQVILEVLVLQALRSVLHLMPDTCPNTSIKIVYISDALIRYFTNIPITTLDVPITDTDIISTFWFMILSMKMSIFLIIMNIIKATNDDIITRNDISGTLITLSVTSVRNN